MKRTFDFGTAQQIVQVFSFQNRSGISGRQRSVAQKQDIFRCGKSSRYTRQHQRGLQHQFCPLEHKALVKTFPDLFCQIVYARIRFQYDQQEGIHGRPIDIISRMYGLQKLCHFLQQQIGIDRPEQTMQHVGIGDPDTDYKKRIAQPQVSVEIRHQGSAVIDFGRQIHPFVFVLDREHHAGKRKSLYKKFRMQLSVHQLQQQPDHIDDKEDQQGKAFVSPDRFSAEDHGHGRQHKIDPGACIDDPDAAVSLIFIVCGKGPYPSGKRVHDHQQFRKNKRDKEHRMVPLPERTPLDHDTAGKQCIKEHQRTEHRMHKEIQEHGYFHQYPGIQIFSAIGCLEYRTHFAGTVHHDDQQKPHEETVLHLGRPLLEQRIGQAAERHKECSDQYSRFMQL